MTTTVEIVNGALQMIGSRTTVTSSELTNQTSNEAIQANLSLEPLRDDLLRMAPWNCGNNVADLVYITSVPGTPENTSASTTQWQKGQPMPPWLYEYQYPVDCLKALYVIPQFAPGFVGAVPITPVTINPTWWNGPPVKYKVALDQFVPVTAAAVSAGGTGYAVGDIITLAETVAGDEPIGAPVMLRVATVALGVVLTATVVNQIAGSATPQGGSYFAQQTNPVAQSDTTGSGSGATFNLTYGTKGDQRIILTNQESAVLSYVRQVTDPNVMDPLFIEAWKAILASRFAMALTGDKTLANMQIQYANSKIVEARVADGNEGLTVNNVLPEWLRIRGVDYPDQYGGDDINWGPLWTSY